MHELPDLISSRARTYYSDMQLEMQVMLPFVYMVYKVICCLSHQYFKRGQSCLHESDSKCIKTMDL